MLLLLLLLGLSAVPLVIIRPGRRRPLRICRLDSAELGACAFFADRLPAQYWFGLHQEDGPMV